jgi:hypothetical protein
LLHFLGRGTRDWLGEFEVFVILDLAKIERAEKLRQANNPRAPAGRRSDTAFRAREIGIEVLAAPALHQADLHPLLRHA